MNEKRQFRFMDSDHGGDGERKTETVTFTFYDGKMELNDKAVYQVEYIPGYKKNKVYHASLNIHYDKTENCGWGGTFSRCRDIRVDNDDAFNALPFDKYEYCDNVPFDVAEAVLHKLNWLEDNNRLLHFKPEEIKLTIENGIWQRPYNLGELSYLGQSETDYHYMLKFDQVNREIIYVDSRGTQKKKLADGQYFLSLENIAALVTEWGIVNNAINVYDLTENIAALLLAWFYIDNHYHEDDEYYIARWLDRQLVTYDGEHAVEYALQAFANNRRIHNADTPGYKGKGEWEFGGLTHLYFDYWDMERIDDPIKDAAQKHVKENW